MPWPRSSRASSPPRSAACATRTPPSAPHSSTPRAPLPLPRPPCPLRYWWLQDQCAQLAAALATAAAVEASALTADLVSYLHKLQPRLLKLLRSNAFKAKPALITLIGASAVMGGDAEVTASIPCLRDAIGSDDWAARKAAAEALAALALQHTDLLTTYKSSCVTFFEARKFDKVGRQFCLGLTDAIFLDLTFGADIIMRQCRSRLCGNR